MSIRLVLFVLAFFLVAANAAAPQGETDIHPYEHRGFFFSAGLGFSYMSLSKVVHNTSVRFSGIDYSSYVILQNDEREYSGFGLPAIDYKLGVAFGNVVTVYSAMSLAFSIGDGTYAESEYENDHLNSYDEYQESGNWGMGAYWGLGFSVYPFKNPGSVMNGFHVGYTAGISVMAGMVAGDEDLAMTGLGNEIEIGKDWWVSDTWSIGVSASYLWLWPIEIFDEDFDGKRFQLMFRITHR